MKLKIFVFVLASLMLFLPLFASCDSGDAKDELPGETAGNGDGSEEKQAEAGPGYDYPVLNCGGEDFTILNSSNTWAFYYAIVHEAMTGDILDDAIYGRNRQIEDMFNVNIKEISAEVSGEVTSKLRTAVQSGDDLYDAVFLPVNSVGTMMSQSMLHDLNAIPGLQLENDWWNQSIRADSAIGGSKRLYFAFSDIDIFSLQCSWCIFVNEDMIQNLGLEKPYGTVKGGKWTYDEFYKYMKAGALLNGDESFKWRADGQAVYGYTSFASGTRALLNASGERLVEIGEGGIPGITVEGERFLSVCGKLAEILGTKAEGGYEDANDYGTPYHFEAMFENSRAFMMGGELKAANSIRAMEGVFGILPMPKYDEIQSRYCTALTVWAPALVVPATNGDIERAGTIMDAMAYLSAKEVTPVFFNSTVSQKQLRNEESIEMLQIIKDSLFFDIGNAYGWTNNMADPIVAALNTGKGDNISSTIEKQLEKTQSNIDAMMDLIGN
ncbi:MAG: hypothetical protein FWG34_08230 [Oscillospiraceae bacterium]|nr:hypothetical protein [Oscillospiraceae bacterium]